MPNLVSSERVRARVKETERFNSVSKKIALLERKIRSESAKTLSKHQKITTASLRVFAALKSSRYPSAGVWIGFFN